MIAEIEVDDVGTVRHLKAWQLAHVKNMLRAKRSTALLAFSCGMTMQQFNRLAPAKQEEIRPAYVVLISPRNI